MSLFINSKNQTRKVCQKMNNSSNLFYHRKSFVPNMTSHQQMANISQNNARMNFNSPLRNQPLNLSINLPQDFNDISQCSSQKFDSSQRFRSPNQRQTYTQNSAQSKRQRPRFSSPSANIGKGNSEYIWANSHGRKSHFDRKVSNLGEFSHPLKGSLFGKPKTTERQRLQSMLRNSSFLESDQSKFARASISSNMSWLSNGGTRYHGMPSSFAANRMGSSTRDIQERMTESKMTESGNYDFVEPLEIRRNIRGISAFNELRRLKKGEIIDPNYVGFERVNRVVMPRNMSYDGDVQIVQLKEDKSLIGRDLYNKKKKARRRRRNRRRKRRLSKSGLGRSSSGRSSSGRSSRSKSKMPKLCGLGAATDYLRREKYRKEREKRFVSDTVEEDMNCALI